MSEFNPQSLTSTALVLATVRKSEKKLFSALATAAARRLSEFNTQDFANIA